MNSVCVTLLIFVRVVSVCLSYMGKFWVAVFGMHGRAVSLRDFVCICARYVCSQALVICFCMVAVSWHCFKNTLHGFLHIILIICVQGMYENYWFKSGKKKVSCKLWVLYVTKHTSISLFTDTTSDKKRIVNLFAN